ncbi:hypothetical protein BDGGKGIB_03839 [Nodularia sphaerocarpa UHCC 0038]|nr:hypothetical protein BDGGKGIB_03839 [Nodularia sphaerocarpa UHCC 0038]
MKTCRVHGDMSSDSVSDQYPTIQICDDCLEECEQEYIMEIRNFDPMYGDSCDSCSKTKAQEEAEQN